MPTRGWTMMTDHDDSDLKRRVRAEMISKLASEWNEIHNRMERRSFRTREDIDDENDYISERYDEEIDDALAKAAKEKGSLLTKEERAEVSDKLNRDLRRACGSADEEDNVKLGVIEELLGDLGARMMRPYEHWNEDERYMEYMENRYPEDERDWY